MSVKAETYKGSCGTEANWSIDTTTGVLEITGSGATLDWYRAGTGEGEPDFEEACEKSEEKYRQWKRRVD